MVFLSYITKASHMLNISRQQIKYDKYNQNLESGTFVTQKEILYKHGAKFIICFNVIMIQTDTAISTVLFFPYQSEVYKENDLTLTAGWGVR